MKKYLVFGISAQMGGVESFLLNYVEHMQDEKNVFEFVMFEKVPDFFRHSSLADCKVHLLPFRTQHPIRYKKEIIRILKQNHYDVLWYNACTLSDVSLMKYAEKWKVPCRIIHSHNSENMGGRAVEVLHKLHKRSIDRLATDYFSCSMKAAKFMFKQDMLESEHFMLVKNAINARKYEFNAQVRESVRQEFHLTDQFVIGHIGRFHFQKNHKLILQIFDEVKKTKKNAKLMLIGNGELKEQIVEQAEKLGIKDSILFLENREDIHELLQGMDVFLFPSLFEGAPIALIEAQASDLPCVVSDTIAKESLLTDKIVRISLEEDVCVWRDQVLEQGTMAGRKNRVELLGKAGYDIERSAKKLKRYIDDKIRKKTLFQGNNVLY